jgi:CBS domain-containing protein
MKARDVMVTRVISVGPDADVGTIAEALVQNGISAVPVVDRHGRLMGIVSEGDLIRRAETGTERRRSWWLEMFTTRDALANDYVKSHALKASDVMTAPAITAGPDTPLRDIADLLERHGIKRVPIVRKGAVVGVVSRANLVQALATHGVGWRGLAREDDAIREALNERLRAEPWAGRTVNMTVQDGVVDLWGFVSSESEKQAFRVAAEATPGVRSVNDKMRILPAGMSAT